MQREDINPLFLVHLITYLKFIVMKMNLKRLQYVLAALLFTVLIEGAMTMGTAFQFEYYNAFGWILQGLIVLFAITAALRVAEEGE